MTVYTSPSQLHDHLLPVGEIGAVGSAALSVMRIGKINPADESLDPDLFPVVYVLWKTSVSRSRPTRVLVAQGVKRDWRLGTLVHIQLVGRYLGEYKIVGIRAVRRDERVGMLPDTAMETDRI